MSKLQVTCRWHRHVLHDGVDWDYILRDMERGMQCYECRADSRITNPELKGTLNWLHIEITPSQEVQTVLEAVDTLYHYGRDRRKEP